MSAAEHAPDCPGRPGRKGLCAPHCPAWANEALEWRAKEREAAAELERRRAEPTLDDVRRVVALMRELGVAKLHGMGLVIELGPAPGAPAAEGPEQKLEPEPLCACGHPWGEHNEAGCGHGCSVERCGVPERVPEEAKKA